MPDPDAPTRRRWFQFGLGTMLLLALVVVLAVYGINEHQQRMRLDAELATLRANAKKPDWLNTQLVIEQSKRLSPP